MNIAEMKKKAKKYVNENRNEIKSTVVCAGCIVACELACYYVGYKRGAKVQKIKDLTEILDFIDQTESKLKEMNTHFLDVNKPVELFPFLNHDSGHVGVNISGKGITGDNVSFNLVNSKEDAIAFAKDLIDFADRATC